MLALRLTRAARPAVQLRRLLVAAAAGGTGFLMLACLGYALGRPERADAAALRLAWSVVPFAATVYFALAVARTDPGTRPRPGLSAVGLGPARLMAVSALTTALSCTLGSLLALLAFLHLRGDLTGLPFDGAAADFLAAGRPLPVPAAATLLALLPAAASTTVAVALRPRDPRPATPILRMYGRFGAYGHPAARETFGAYGRFGARLGRRTATEGRSAADSRAAGDGNGEQQGRESAGGRGDAGPSQPPAADPRAATGAAGEAEDGGRRSRRFADSRAATGAADQGEDSGQHSRRFADRRAATEATGEAEDGGRHNRRFADSRAATGAADQAEDGGRHNRRIADRRTATEAADQAEDSGQHSRRFADRLAATEAAGEAEDGGRHNRRFADSRAATEAAGEAEDGGQHSHRFADRRAATWAAGEAEDGGRHSRRFAGGRAAVGPAGSAGDGGPAQPQPTGRRGAGAAPGPANDGTPSAPGGATDPESPSPDAGWTDVTRRPPKDAPVGLPWGIAVLTTGLTVQAYAERSNIAVLTGWLLAATGLVLAAPGLTHLCGLLLQSTRPGALRLLAGRVLMTEATRIGRPLGVVSAVTSAGYAMTTLYAGSAPSFGPLTTLGASLVTGCTIATVLTAAVETRQCRAETTAALLRLGAPVGTLRAAAALRAAALLALFGPLTLLIAALSALPVDR